MQQATINALSCATADIRCSVIFVLKATSTARSSGEPAMDCVGARTGFSSELVAPGSRPCLTTRLAPMSDRPVIPRRDTRHEHSANRLSLASSTSLWILCPWDHPAARWGKVHLFSTFCQ